MKIINNTIAETSNSMVHIGAQARQKSGVRDGL